MAQTYGGILYIIVIIVLLLEGRLNVMDTQDPACLWDLVAEEDQLRRRTGMSTIHAGVGKFQATAALRSA